MSVRVMAEVWGSAIEDAKMIAVLLVLANYADEQGLCFPGTERIARESRYSKRTVIRVLALLEKEGWITVVQRGAGRPTGLKDWERAANMSQYQVNLEALKRCQADTFSEDKKVSGRHLLEGGKGDQQTPFLGKKKVSAATGKGVSRDKKRCQPRQKTQSPPHPPLNTTVNTPVKATANARALRAPAAAPFESPAPEEPAATAGLNAEQQEHLGRVRARGGEAAAAEWESYYREQNQREAHAEAERAAAGRAEAEKRALLERELTTAVKARGWVMRECGFVPSRREGELEEALDGVLRQERDAGGSLAVTAARMAAAWKRQQACGRQLRVSYGAVKFFKLAVWRDEAGWSWK